MKRSIKIQEIGNTYIDKDLVNAGFVGDVPMLANALTLTMIKPGAQWEDVKRSLEIAIQDIELRMKHGEKAP